MHRQWFKTNKKKIKKKLLRSLEEVLLKLKKYFDELSEIDSFNNEMDDVVPILNVIGEPNLNVINEPFNDDVVRNSESSNTI